MEDIFSDNYEHVDDKIFYTCLNVPGPGVDIGNFQSQLCVNCSCVDHCGDGCVCLASTGRNYQDGLLSEEKMFQSSLGVIECSDMCSCAGNCGNRLVQCGPVSGLDIFHHNVKGASLRTLKPIRKCQFICEYAGEVIGKCEAKNRVKNSCNPMNYIFVLKEHSGSAIIMETIVDPTQIGNIGRYINHSCQPNSVIVPIRFDSLVPHLAVFANNDIAVGEEITFDYSGGEIDNHKLGTTLCCCGSSDCRKFIPFSPDLL